MSIEDFGEKIGGAKKELWRTRGLAIEDILQFNDAERRKHIKKDNIWKKPDYNQMLAEGKGPRIVYFTKLIRDALPTKPVLQYGDSEEAIAQKEEGYISVITDFRDKTMKLKSEEEMKEFFNQVVAPYLENPGSFHVRLKPEAFDCINNKLLKAISKLGHNFYFLDREIKEKYFGFSEEEKMMTPYGIYKFDSAKNTFDADYGGTRMTIPLGVGSIMYIYPDERWLNPEEWVDGTYFVLRNRSILQRNFSTEEEARKFALSHAKENAQSRTGRLAKKPRKKAFLPKQLESIERVGEDYRQEINITGNDYLQGFQFRAGEFGNWLSEKDRQASLNFGYDAFLDLCQAINISPADASLDGRLAIAFGARGSGNALAHYEPEREVINLTKMKGAGSLAHEWGHAMDDIIGKKLGYSGMMTVNPNKRGGIAELYDLMQVMKVDESSGTRKRTTFYENSITFDQGHSKTDHGYWQSPQEMFARAFACYVKDRLEEKGVRSDYLCGHAHGAISPITLKDGSVKMIKAYPEGEERTRINEKFDALFSRLREMELFHPFEKAIEVSSLENSKRPNLDRQIASSITTLTEGPVHYDAEIKESKKGQLEFSLF